MQLVRGNGREADAFGVKLFASFGHAFKTTGRETTAWVTFWERSGSTFLTHLPTSGGGNEMQAHHRALESSAGMVTMFHDVVVAETKGI